MALLCPSPLWNYGRVSACVENKYLNGLVPLAALLASPIIYSVSYYYRRYRQNKPIEFEPIPANNDDEVRGPPGPQQYITTISPIITILEALGVLIDICLGAVLPVHSEAPEENLFALASVLFSVYLLLLLVGRYFSAKSSIHLRSHSAILYVVQWLCLALVAQAIFFKQSGELRDITILIRFAIFTALCLFHWTAKRVPRRAFLWDDVPYQKEERDETASLLSRLTLSWVDDLVWKAYRATLEVSDLDQLNRNQTSAVVVPRFRATVATTLPLLWRAFHFFKYDLLKQGAWATARSVAVFIPPVLIKLILEYLESPDGTQERTAWLYVGGLLISGLLAGISECQCAWIGHKISAKLRSILVSEIYAKVLRKQLGRPVQTKPEPDSDKEANTESHASDGNIFNLMSGDADRVSGISGSLYLVWITFPVQMTIGTYLLYRILGISGAVGVIVVTALLPLNILLSKRVAAVQRHLLAASDARIQASNELLNNIRTIKYCAWEVPFRERVLEKRRLEMKRMRSRFIWWSLSMTVFHSLPFVVTILTCFFYAIVWGNNLGTSIAFPALVIFSILRIPLDRMADSITFILQANVSLTRIGKFLKEPDTDKFNQASRINTSVIGFHDATLSWPTHRSTKFSDERTASAESFRLDSLQIRFLQGALNVVCGPSGAGKSLLLLSLLGEMDLINGQVFLPTNETSAGLEDPLSEMIAYCPQEPWIMNRSIRANILIGLPFDGHRYQAVLHAVALVQDLAELDQGDQTLAGENGSRLSGGQKQRVAFARALYSKAKCVLLDDCLSAVDSRTANHIFFHAVKGPLMRGRTCILATHHTQLAIPHSDYVVVLGGGKVKGQGTAEELVSAGVIAVDMTKAKPETPPTAALAESLSNPHNISLDDDQSSPRSSLHAEPLHDESNVEWPEAKVDYKESKSEGAVPWSVAKAYLVAMGPGWYWIIVLAGFVAQQLASLGTNLWIKEWAFQYDKLEEAVGLVSSHPSNTSNQGKVDAWYYLTVYTVICFSFALITFLRSLVIFHGSLKASSRIYERLLNSILHAKLLFFDRVPLGQITNRFSNDIGQLDLSLAPFSVSAFQLAASVAMAILLISIVLPVFLPVAAIICLAYYYVTVLYINGARDLKRIEAVERSPMYQQFGETLAGYISIRAYARTSMFIAQNRVLVDRLNKPYLLLRANQEWLILRIGILSSLISFSTGAFILWKQDSVNPGTAGLVLTYASTFTENVMWLVQVYAIIQQNLNSVERIVEYTEVEQEAIKPLRKPVPDIPQDWPSQGGVRFHGYTTRYAPDLEPVLKGIDFQVRAGGRVAIVGRTGAGKSTLTLALIRGLEADGGHIDIDGVDISSVSLEQLRQVVTVVPQDPKLFDGSLRDNLDPLHRHSDEEMLAQLRTVRLMDAANPGSTLHLDHAADALSHGERQLLCIARALLRRSHVLVLDEATASIDHATDAAIQAGLRASVAAGTTVLTIAHRLLTIADYEHVVVLDAGRVVEQGSVSELLDRRGESAIFRGLCEESGDIEKIEQVGRLLH